MLFLSLNICYCTLPDPNLIPATNPNPMDQLKNLPNFLQSDEEKNKNKQLIDNQIDYFSWGKWYKKLLEIIIKAVITSLVGAILNDFFEFIKVFFGFHSNLYRNILETEQILSNYNKLEIFLAIDQQMIMDKLSISIMDFIKTGKNKPTETIIIPYGPPGVGKTAFMYILANNILNFDKKTNKIGPFGRLIRKVLPNYLKSIFKIYNTKNCILMTMSGATYYNYSNEPEKGALHLKKNLDYMMDCIKNNPNVVFILLIDEGENITQDPSFARSLKISTTELSMLNKGKQHGFGLIILTTNFPEQCEETLARRLLTIEFDLPDEATKLKTFLSYLKKHMVINNVPLYTHSIIDSIVHWLKYCLQFSHSDIENLVWLLKLKATTSDNLVSLLDVLKILLVEWKKKEIIVKKNKKNLELQELAADIYKIEQEENNFFDLLINPPTISTDIEAF